MTDELAILLEDFPGSANRTRCFTHVLNLVAKSVMKQFDLPKGRAGEAPDAAAKRLAQLADEIENEEKLSGGDFSEEEEDDNTEGLIDIRDEMSEEEVLRLNESLQPVRLVLAKVSLCGLKLYIDDKCFHSFANLHLLSRTPPLSFFRNGIQYFGSMPRRARQRR